MKRLLIAVVAFVGMIAGDLARAVGPVHPAGHEKTPDHETPPVIFSLTSKDPLATGKDGRILLRELGRQAVLIAARDGLGLPTRDQSLREPFPQAADAPIDVETFANLDNKYKIRISRAGKELFVEQFPLPMKKPAPERNNFLIISDYYDLAEKMEALSRGPLVDALQKAGFQSALVPPGDPARGPDDIEPLLDQMTIITQFDAVRRAHEQIRLHGESPELLGFLVRGYANLGELTVPDWNASSKVFEARAILYGLRMVAHDPKSPMAHAHCAYAWAMAGFHYRAFQELNAAQALATPQEKANVPGWAELIDPLCSYDIPRLENLAKTKTRRAPLAMYMAFLAAEPSESESFVIEQEKKALQLNPRCLRLVDAVSTRAGVSYGHQFTEASFVVLADEMYSHLGLLRHLPPSVVKLLPVDPTQLLDPKMTAGIEKKLVDAGATESTEPSLAVLGRLLQESSFLCVYRRAHFMAVQWGVDRSEFLAAVDPLIADHPYGSFIRAMRFSTQSDVAQIRAMTKDLKPVDAEPRMFDLYAWPNRMSEPSPFKKRDNTMAAIWHEDYVPRDMLERFRLGASKHDAIAYINSVDSNSPIVAADRVTHGWASLNGKLDEFEHLFGEYPDVQAALARKFIELGKPEEAATHLNKYIAKAPDKWAFEALADIQLKRGDEAGWLATMKQVLQQEDYGLTHAQIQVRIANHYMDKEDYASAEPYAEAAAQTWAQWAMQTAERCYEHEGKWNKAEEWVRNESERYDTPLHLYIWCRRTGHGDIAAARQVSLAFLSQVRPPNPDEAGLFYLCENKPKEALEQFQDALHQTGEPRDALTAAMLLDANNDAAGRDEMLKAAAAFRAPPPYGLSDKQKSEMAYAKNMQAAFAQGLTPETTAEQLQKIMQIPKTGDERYFTAKFLATHGHPEPAKDLLRRSVAAPGTTLFSTYLSQCELDQLGDKPAEK